MWSFTDPGRVRIVYTMYNHIVRIPIQVSLATRSSKNADASTTEISTPAMSVEDHFPPIEIFNRDGEKDDKQTGAGPVAVSGSEVIMMFSRKLRDGGVNDYSIPREIIAFTIGYQHMEIDALHIGVKGMSVGGERLIVVPACYAVSRQDWEAFFGESDTDLEIVFDMELLKIE